MDWWQIVLALIGALGGLTGLAGFLTAVSTARQSARKTEVQVLRETIDELQEENKRLGEMVLALQKENAALRTRINDLHIENEQLRKKLGMSPFRQPIKGLATRDVD